MADTKKLPVFRATITDDFVEETNEAGQIIKKPTGLSAMSFVDHPATDMMWMTFSEHKRHEFKANKDLRIISGVAMCADQPIYRNENGFEFYVQFGKEDVFKIGKKFFRDGLIKSVNLMHRPDAFVDNVYLIESIFVDKDRGTTIPEQFGKVPDGSWFTSFAVDDEKLWTDLIKPGALQGFSVEGLFKHIKIKEEKAQTLEKLHDKIVNMRREIENLISK